MVDHEANEILLLPFFGQGHLFPFIELLKHLSSLNYTATLLIPSSLTSSIPASLGRRHLLEIPSTLGGPPLGTGPLGGPHEQLGPALESLLSSKLTRPACCVVVDVMMSWANDVFNKLGIPVVSLFTSGACSAAIEYGSWKAQVSDLRADEARFLAGLPEEMAVSYVDLKRQAHHPPPPPPPPHGGQPPPGGPHGPGPNPPGQGPPGLGRRPPWVDEVEGTVGIMMNTCHDLEGPFLEYMANHIGKPVWGVGPLLPEEYWRWTGKPIHDHEIRANKESNHTEEDVDQWLGSKPYGSVLYVSFGSEVEPTSVEYLELASALRELSRPFIWVVRSNLGKPSSLEEDNCHGNLESEVGERGLIIRGWAPQLLILSHPSTGWFLSHCGWNSMMEAIGRGVPILAWPIRGDQHHNAKLVVSYLKVGYMIKEDECSSSLYEFVKKDEIVRGIEKLMGDREVKQRADVLCSKFKDGFPVTSKTALDAFIDFILGVQRMA